MADFRISWAKTYGNEGNYSNDKNDPGGETYKGVSRKNWPKWSGWPIVDKIKTLRAGSTISLLNWYLSNNATLKQMVINFYEDNFWKPLSLSEINDQQIANNLFDCSVNEGEGEAGFILQKACNMVISELQLAMMPLTVDGQVGPKTINMVNCMDYLKVFDAINTLRNDQYNKIVSEHPNMIVWLKVWQRRLVSYYHNT